MKFKRNKTVYQGGGTIGGGSVKSYFYAPLPQAAPYIPQLFMQGQQGNTPTGTPQQGAGGKEKPLELKGLTSDVNAVSKIVNEAKAEMASLSEYDITMQSAKFRDATNKLQQALAPEVMNMLANNQKEYENAVAIAKERNIHDTTATIVRNGRGFIVVKDEKGIINYMSPEEYAKNKNKVRKLSISEVLNERQNNVAFDEMFREAVTTTNSKLDLLKTLNDQLVNVKDNERKIKTDGMLATAAVFKKDGLNGMLEHFKNNKEQLASLQGTWNFLPESMKTQLHLEAVENGYTTPQEMQLFALGAMANVFSKASSDFSSREFVTDDVLLSGGSGKDKTQEIGSYVLASGFNDPGEIGFSFGGKSVTFYGERINKHGISNLFSTSQVFSSAVNFNDAYLLDGEKLRDKNEGEDMLNRAMLKEGSVPVYIKLPVDSKGNPLVSATNIDQLNDINKIIKENPENVAFQKLREKGINAVSFKSFIAADALVPVPTSMFSTPKISVLKKANRSSKIYYENAINSTAFSYNLDTPGWGYDEVNEGILLFPVSDKKGLVEADNIFRSIQSKVVIPDKITPASFGNQQSQQFIAGSIDEIN
jgi:hypothetical protein